MPCGTRNKSGAGTYKIARSAHLRRESLAGAVFYYSRDRAGEHPQAHLASYTGIFQADACRGYGNFYEPGRRPGPILEAACWVHARRPVFVMADLAENARPNAQGEKPTVISPLALEAVRRIDARI
jgi:transposase